jgi:hypothetical protein
MDEQSQNESQPKVRRAKNGGAEEPQPSEMPPGSPDQAKQEALGNFGKPSQAGEEASRTTNKEIRQAESVLPWPFQATQHALEEWTHFFGRATERNFRATDDLSECHSITGLLQWQGDLIQNNFEDWLQTSFSVFSVSAGKFFSYSTQ